MSVRISGSGAKILNRTHVVVPVDATHCYTNRQIAEALCLSVRTVESHRANIMGKLALDSRVELVHYAMEHGLLDETAQ